MIQCALSLLDRYVSVLERQAVVNERMAALAEAQAYGAPLVPRTCADEACDRQAEQPTEDPQAVPTWDPYSSEVMARYTAVKTGILKAELDACGIEYKPAATGAELHQLLLDSAKSDALKGEEPASGAEITVEDVRNALKTCAVEHGKDTAKAILASFRDSQKVADLLPVEWPAVIKALNEAKS